ncbi:MAG: hypothetical protein AAF566_12430, partial [Pseudomonadota bacterium]
DFVSPITKPILADNFHDRSGRQRAPSAVVLDPRPPFVLHVLAPDGPSARNTPIKRAAMVANFKYCW